MQLVVLELIEQFAVVCHLFERGIIGLRGLLDECSEGLGEGGAKQIAGSGRRVRLPSRNSEHNEHNRRDSISG